MNSYPPNRLQAHAFTLVELLTVIAIIAILMGLLFPAIGVVKDQARKAEAKTACANIVAAVKAYNTEYGKFPNPNTSTSDAVMGGASGDNADLFYVLRAKPQGKNDAHKFNPRRVIFFEGKSATNPTAPKGGFSDTNGNFYDPWGAAYGVGIDYNYDNTVSDLPYTDFKSATTAPQVGAAAFSLGKDGLLGTGGAFKNASGTSDDVISWQ